MKQKLVYWIVNDEKKKFKVGMCDYNRVLYLGHECIELNVCCEHKNPENELDTEGYIMYASPFSETKETAESTVGILFRVFATLGYFPDNDMVIYKRDHKHGNKVSRDNQKYGTLCYGPRFPLSELNSIRYLSCNFGEVYGCCRNV